VIPAAKSAVAADVVGVGLLLIHYALHQLGAAGAPRSIACPTGDPHTSWPADAVANSVNACIIANAYEQMPADERLDLIVELMASSDEPAEPLIVRYSGQAVEALATARCRSVESPRPYVGRLSSTLRTTRPLTRCPRTTPLAANAPPIELPALQAAGVAYLGETCPMT